MARLQVTFKKTVIGQMDGGSCKVRPRAEEQGGTQCLGKGETGPWSSRKWVRRSSLHREKADTPWPERGLRSPQDLCPQPPSGPLRTRLVQGFRRGGGQWRRQCLCAESTYQPVGVEDGFSLQTPCSGNKHP